MFIFIVWYAFVLSLQYVFILTIWYFVGLNVWFVLFGCVMYGLCGLIAAFLFVVLLYKIWSINIVSYRGIIRIGCRAAMTVYNLNWLEDCNDHTI